MSNQQLAGVVENVSESTEDMQKELLDTSKLLALLSKFEALIILHNAKHGIEADLSTHSKVGLTKSRYYSRLMRLKNAGLIKKKGKSYFQTALGSFLYENCVDPAIHAVRNRKKMLVIDVLESNGNFSDEELLRIKTCLHL